MKTAKNPDRLVVDLSDTRERLYFCARCRMPRFMAHGYTRKVTCECGSTRFVLEGAS